MDIDPFAVLATPAPSFSPAAASDLLENLYGRRGRLEPLHAERDQNFLVRDEGGQRYVLKIANSAEDPGVTEFQNAALVHLEERHPDLPVPRVIPSVNARRLERVPGPGDGTHRVRLLSWVPGAPLGRMQPRPDVAAPMGAMLARLGAGLAEFEHDASDYPLLWDISRAAQLLSETRHIPDAGLRGECRSWLEHFATDLEPRLQACRSQVIYNDLNSDNVLVDSGQQVSGIIDFGDLVRAPLVVDVAVACAYLCRHDGAPFGQVREFLKAYNTVNPLEPAEFDLLPDLMRTRNIVTIVIANWRAQQFPENRDYILSSEPYARRNAELLDGVLPEDLAADLSEVCGD